MTPDVPTLDLDALDMLRDTARRFLEDPGSTIDALGELGLLGLLVAENVGGSGWLPVEAGVVAEEAGRALTAMPVVGNLLAAGALAATNDPPIDTLAALLSGAATGGLARAGDLVVDESGPTISGVAQLVGDESTSILVVIDSSQRVAVVDASGSEVTIEGAPQLDTTRPGSVVTFDGAVAVVLDPASAARIVDAATILMGADALGTLRAGAVLVREHLMARTAFERPIASFQALQHRLADLEVHQAGLGSLVERTSLALAAGDSSARRLASATHAYVVAHVPAALDDCIQLSGGIGFTWEWPIHHALRRATVDSTLPIHIGLRRADLTSGGDAEPALDGDPHREFRSAVRGVIREHAPYIAREGHRAPVDAQQEADLRAWYRTLYGHQILGAAWPEDRGGDPSHLPIHDLIVTEELIRARAPRPIDQVRLASHVLLQFGTTEQKDRYLPPIREGADIWCQLFSEPDAGSDLAGIKAKATLQDDGTWLLSGQKTWTTDGHWAQMGLALLRTSTDGGRHAGITVFVVPMDAEGLVVQPMQTIGGAYEFNDAFLDGVVLAADSVIGPIGDGWRVAMSGLEIERFGVGGDVVLLDLLLDDVAALARAVDDADSVAIDVHLSELTADAQAAKAFLAGHVERALAGRDQVADASIAKILYSETYNRIAAYGTQLATAHTPLPDDAREPAQRLEDAWLWSRAITISGGSSEIMRNIIAKRGLGLPTR